MNVPASNSPYAAVFIDFENVYYFLKNHFQDPPDLNDYVLDLIRGLREKLRTEKELDCLVLNAYADFERIATAPQGALYLMGVSTRNVLGTDHKNAADMQLCIDALEVMYTRPEIGTFVLVAGDRDYIPLLRHLRRQARQVLVAGFRESVSGDLLQNIGADKFLDAREMLASDTVKQLEKRRPEHQQRREESRRLREQGLPGVESAAARQARAAAGAIPAPAKAADSEAAPAATETSPPPTRPTTPRPVEEAPAFASIHRLDDENERGCLAFMLAELQRLRQHRHNVNELWLSPFVRRMTDEFPELSDYERRDLITRLRDAGAIRIEKRDGEPHPFSVIVLNYQHPDVLELNPGEDA